MNNNDSFEIDEKNIFYQLIITVYKLYNKLLYSKAESKEITESIKVSYF